jgi:hypothetical protein
MYCSVICIKNEKIIFQNSDQKWDQLSIVALITKINTEPIN